MCSYYTLFPCSVLEGCLSCGASSNEYKHTTQYFDQLLTNLLDI